MDIIDKIKCGAKNTKEKAVLTAISNAMSMIDDWTKDVRPKNEISKFLEENFGILFQTRQADQIGGIMGMLTKVVVDTANEDPEFVEEKLLQYYEAFRVFYKDYQERKCKIPP